MRPRKLKGNVDFGAEKLRSEWIAYASTFDTRTSKSLKSNRPGKGAKGVISMQLWEGSEHTEIENSKLSDEKQVEAKQATDHSRGNHASAKQK